MGKIPLNRLENYDTWRVQFSLYLKASIFPENVNKCKRSYFMFSVHLQLFYSQFFGDKLQDCMTSNLIVQLEMSKFSLCSTSPQMSG